jgi:predicted nucleic acid-binding protein
MIVVDSNVLTARSMEHDKSSLAVQVERIDSIWIVPPLWRYEFQNILTKAIWAKRLTIDTAVEKWRQVVAYMDGNEHEPSPEKVIELSAHNRITAYDANFIALAIEMDVMCVTEDGELQEKFPAIAISMEDFLKQGITGGWVREAQTTYRIRKRTKRPGK